MTTQTKEIIKYTIKIDRHVGWKFSADAKNVDFDEWIYCKTADKKVVRLFFLTNRDVPPKSFIDSRGNFYAFFKKDQYIYCLDLLRNVLLYLSVLFITRQDRSLPKCPKYTCCCSVFRVTPANVTKINRS